MKISIIIPFYDKDVDYINNMITEVQKLTFDKEVIFVDDRNDKTIDVRSKYNIQSEYKLINSSNDCNNIGTFEARRAGVNASTGDYIWFVDNDDELNDIKNVDTYTDDIYAYAYNFHLKDGFLNEVPLYLFTPFKQIIISNEPNIDYILHTTKSALWNKVFKAQLVKDTLAKIPVLKNFKNHEDGYLYTEILHNFGLKLTLRYSAIYNYTSLEKQQKLVEADRSNPNFRNVLETRIPKECPDREFYIKYIEYIYKYGE